jgi:UDP-N-acetylmuramate--alanine ligase
MRYHIVGIAGAGMSAIAQLLLDQGHAVSGSDLLANALTAGLAARGAQIWQGHDAAYARGADAVLTTSAAPPNHPELQAARALGTPVLKRNDLWREWSRLRPVIAVAGTHGKTTTTAMIATVLARAGLNPGFLIGGVAPSLGTNARWGDQRAPLVIEADEYDRAFLALAPSIAVVTNVELDHVDIYPTLDDYRAAFAAFAAASPLLIADADGWPGLRGIAVARLIPYGPGATDGWQIGPARVEHGRTYASLRYAGDPPLEVGLALRLAGDHNVRNATAAIAVAHALGLNLAEATLALMEFGGTERRFEIKGEAGGVTVVDDYAHHPTEVRATLQAARARYGRRRLVAYVQPHTYSRTRALLGEWPAAFADADVVLVGDIYGARERDAGDVSAELLAYRIAERHPAVRDVGGLDDATAAVRSLLRPGDVLVTMGAGDGNQVGERILKELSHDR